MTDQSVPHTTPIAPAPTDQSVLAAPSTPLVPPVLPISPTPRAASASAGRPGPHVPSVPAGRPTPASGAASVSAGRPTPGPGAASVSADRPVVTDSSVPGPGAASVSAGRPMVTDSSVPASGAARVSAGLSVRSAVAVPRGGVAVAVAHPNIALIKYWGKRDEGLVLPRTDSLSMTLDIFPTTTRVRCDPDAERDTVTLNGVSATGEAYRRVCGFLDLVRAVAGRSDRAVVDTVNTVPTGAGLASSASGFAALAVAAGAVYGLGSDPAGLSRLARRGSGSASRSVFGGFAVWHAGPSGGALREADRASYAEPVPTGCVDPALVIAVVDAGPKAVSSRTAMRHTVRTSPLYEAWVASSREDLRAMREALLAGDLDAVGRIAEGNALGMHATMLAARPAVRYLAPATLAVLDVVSRLRGQGVSAYATMDAGPNVKVLCRRADAGRVACAVREAVAGVAVHVAGPGPAARLLEGERW